jgi:protein TonB
MKSENLKSEKLEKKRTVLFQVGMIISLALVLLAFEWKTPKISIESIDWESRGNFEEDIVIVIPPKEKPVMPLPKVVQVFVAVDDKSEVDETLEFIIESAEEGLNDPDLFVDFVQHEIVPEDTAIYDYPSKYPEFPGGEPALFKYLSENLKYTKDAREINLEGPVYVSFVVLKDGSISDVQILRGLGAGLDEEVIRVIKGMPDWNPGMQHGKNVNVRYRIPVKFNLN